MVLCMFVFLASYMVEAEQVENGVRRALHMNYELTYEERRTRNQPQSQRVTERTHERKLLLHECSRKSSTCKPPVKVPTFGTVSHTMLSMSF